MHVSSPRLAFGRAAMVGLALIVGAACLGKDEGPPTAAPTTAPQIAYVGADGGLWLINADGSGKRQIVPEPARDAVWSPDGTKIAYVDITGASPIPYSQGELWVWDESSGERRKIDDDVSSPRWEVGGRYISYWKDTPNPQSDHPRSDPWAADVTQEYAKWQLPVDAGGGSAWSPDGNPLAYGVGRPTECERECYHRASLFLVSLDGSQRRKLTDDGVLFPLSESWSPDGHLLAYWKNEHGGSARVGDVYAMDLTTGVEIRLGEFTSDEFPQWAPSKDVPIFHNLRIDPETGGTTELFERPGAIVAWSPDATKVAYVEGRPFGPAPRSLVVLDLNSGQRTTFHTSQAQIPHVASPGYRGNWSPDGRYFLFAASDANTPLSSLNVADTTTGTARAVMANAYGSYSPAGDLLLVQREEPLPQPTVMPSPTPSPTPLAVPQRTIWVADPDGSNPVQIAAGTAIDGPAGRAGWRPAAGP